MYIKKKYQNDVSSSFETITCNLNMFKASLNISFLQYNILRSKPKYCLKNLTVTSMFSLSSIETIYNNNKEIVYLTNYCKCQKLGQYVKAKDSW